MHTNVRGLDLKIVSLKSIFNVAQPGVLTLIETFLLSIRRFKLPGYSCFNINRKNKKCGGIATCVKGDERLHTLKVTEGSDDLEMIITRHSQFATLVNVINIYGKVETRSTQTEIEERWTDSNPC